MSLEWIKSRLAQRTDTEHKQAILRIVIVTIASSYFLVTESDFSLNNPIVLNAVLSFVISIGLMIHVIWKTDQNPVRRVLGMLHDSAATSIYLIHGGERSFLFLFVYLWITIGNGFRYGIRYMGICVGVCIIGIVGVSLSGQDWIQTPYLGIGLLINYLLVSGYTAYLITRLREASARLHELATHDSLTGLLNRRAFEQELELSLSMKRHNEKSLACVYFDLNGFKLVNDRYGHAVGDALLRDVAQRVKKSTRDRDCVARLGGDEFAILLRSMDRGALDAEVVLSRLNKSIAEITEVTGKKVVMSASLGCVVLNSESPKEMLTTDQVLKLADQQMYEAKREGKSRSIVTLTGSASTVTFS